MSSPPPASPAHAMLDEVRQIGRTLSAHVNSKRGGFRFPSPNDPVRRKNLERASGQLQDLMAILGAPAAPWRSGEELAPLEAVLDRLKTPRTLTMHGAWEVADALEIELIRLSEAPRLLVLLESYEGKRLASWRARFPEAELATLLVQLRTGPVSDDTLQRAREVLIELERIRINGFRRDRALVEQKAHYLGRMSVALLLALAALAVMLSLTLPGDPAAARDQAEEAGAGEAAEDRAGTARADTTRRTVPAANPPAADGTRRSPATPGIPAADTTPDPPTADPTRERAPADTTGARAARTGGGTRPGGTGARSGSGGAGGSETPKRASTWQLLVLAALAGTVGSILSRAIRLGGRDAFSGISRSSDDSTPLGIRAQLAAWRMFFSQVAVGTAAGVLTCVILLSDFLEIANINPTNPLHASVIALLAGFSERFFIGTLDDLVNRSSGPRDPDRPDRPSDDPTSPPR